MRVGAEVGASDARAARLRGDCPHGRAGRQRERDGDTGDAAAHEQHEWQQQGPEDIELLFDGERPQVPQQLGLAARHAGREVRRAGGDRQPVVREGRRPQHLPAEADEHIAADEPRRARAHRHDEGERRQQSPRAAHPERAQCDASGRRPLPQQERSDEEPGDDEEGIHTDEAGVQERAREQVVDDDQQDRDGAKTVESRVAGRRGGRHDEVRARTGEEAARQVYVATLNAEGPAPARLG